MTNKLNPEQERRRRDANVAKQRSVCVCGHYFHEHKQAGNLHSCLDCDDCSKFREHIRHR